MRILVHAVLALLAGALAIAPLRAAPPRRNWLATVAVTPAGGHLLGNPAAKLKLVEYISYTCPHCAAFETQAAGALRIGYVQPGTVSVEVRNLVRDPVDLTVAMLTNCGPADRFFANHDAFLLHQASWIAIAEKTTDAQRQRWSSGPLPDRLRAIASDLGFYPTMATRGYTRVQADRCLADPALLKRIMAQQTEATRLGVQATPSFLIDGTLLAQHDWASLETQLKAGA